MARVCSSEAAAGQHPGEFLQKSWLAFSECSQGTTVPSTSAEKPSRLPHYKFKARSANYCHASRNLERLSNICFELQAATASSQRLQEIWEQQGSRNTRAVGGQTRVGQRHQAESGRPCKLSNIFRKSVDGMKWSSCPRIQEGRANEQVVARGVPRLPNIALNRVEPWFWAEGLGLSKHG